MSKSKPKVYVLYTVGSIIFGVYKSLESAEKAKKEMETNPSFEAMLYCVIEEFNLEE